MIVFKRSLTNANLKYLSTKTKVKTLGRMEKMTRYIITHDNHGGHWPLEDIEDDETEELAPPVQTPVRLRKDPLDLYSFTGI